MLYAIVAVLALILDQGIKYWTTVNIVVDTGEAKLIPGLIHLANVHNTGAAFSFLEGARWFFVLLCILFCLLVVYVLVKNIITHPVARWMAVLVMAGAIGNCIDRIVCGYVVDMLEFDFLIFGRQFPVFNIADIYITLGAIIFCICILTEKPKAAKKAAPQAAAQPAAERKQPRAPEQAPRTADREKKPLLARRQHTPIPDFPKREHTKDVAAVDPNDPFAEWEKSAAPAQEAPAPARTEAPAATKTVYTQPAAAQKNYSPEAVEFVSLLSETKAAPAAPAEPSPAPAPEPAPVPAPTAEAAAPAPKAESETFNLDDILAEFRDL